MILTLTSGKLLTAISLGSSLAARKVYNETVPGLVAEFNKNCVIVSRCQIVDVLIGYAEAGARYISSGENDPLSKHVDDICVLFLSLVTHYATSLRIRCLRGSCTMMPYPHTRHANIMESTLMLAVTDHNVEVREEANKSLELISRNHTKSLIDGLIQKVVEYIRTARNCDGMETNLSAQHETTNYQQFSSAMTATLSVSAARREVADLTLPEVVGRLKKELKDHHRDHVQTIISTLLAILDKSQSDPKYMEFCFRNVVQPLVTMVIVTSQTGGYDVIDPVLTSVGRMVLLAMTHLEVSVTSQYVSQITNLFVNGSCELEDFSTLRDFRPLEATSSSQKTRLVSLLCAVVSSQKQNCDHTALQQKLESLSVTSSDHVTREFAAKFLAQIVNKMEKNEESDAYLVEVTSRLKSNMADSHVILLWAWLTKALLARGHPHYKVFLEEIINRLQTDQGAEFAHAYSILLSRDDDVMNTLTHSNVRLMYRQRLFVESLPKLVHGFKEAEKDRKSPYLTALSHLLSGVPKQVVLPELGKLLPMLVQSLQSDSVPLWLSTLDSVSTLLTEARDVMTSYTDSLVPQFIKLAQYKDKMQVRISALQCLAATSSLPTHVILPHQKVVLHALRGLLDDRKRLVRKEAVKARCEWFLVGSAS